MSRYRRIVLQGFEEALVEAIAAGFRFDDPYLKTIPLVAGTHLFVQDLPSVDQILQTSANFDRGQDPTIALYTNAGPGVMPSASSGALHEWSILIVLRLGKVPEVVKALLEQLVAFLVDGSLRRARVGAFRIRGAQITGRPTVFARQGDDSAYVSATVRFHVVPVPDA